MSKSKPKQEATSVDREMKSRQKSIERLTREIERIHDECESQVAGVQRSIDRHRDILETLKRGRAVG